MLKALTLQTLWPLLPVLHCVLLCCSRDSSQVRRSSPCPNPAAGSGHCPMSPTRVTPGVRSRGCGGQGVEAFGVRMLVPMSAGGGCRVRAAVGASRVPARCPAGMCRAAGSRRCGRTGGGCPWTLVSLGPAPSLINRGRSRSLAAAGDGCPPRGGGEGSAAGPGAAGTGSGSGAAARARRRDGAAAGPGRAAPRPG